ncbi:ATP phosphoribosyltransferase regulatory subunit [Thiomicrospira sp. XS5]|uniref:ATP phosphoribosyltransferase regulatory subunit n=1 Tax=Thiomicrospira sp. XS5 TaxID=1775636 RepID=UPI0007469C3C|nr:ATP phosphoribosyltransferase regulatory subunit [Thiomicrospira sp. XS5]KUJ75164.1 ATP phosphoribosyltransferase regulatory subunit [Thiomicrospira sp. XS5]
MQQNIWFTPDGLEDLLPDEAKKLECYRRQLLDGFELSGYDLVLPPIAEFTDSLLTGKGRHLAVDTCRFTDQESGKMMGVRADMTPQVARIASNRIKQKGIQRLCYVGEVLKTRNNRAKGSRSPIEVGAELFGHSGVESDIEVIELMVSSLNGIGLNDLTLSLGHVSVVDTLMNQVGLSDAQQETMVDILLRKSIPEYDDFVATLSLSPALTEAFKALLTLCGNADDVMAKMDVLANVSSDMAEHLAHFKAVLSHFAAFEDLTIHVDLADIRGYQYHTGMIFSCYAADRKMYQLARGGRYDGIGSEFGVDKPATGFSLDLRGMLDLLDQPTSMKKEVVYAPNAYDADLLAEIERLKAQQTVVKRFYDFSELPDGASYLESVSGTWTISVK